MPQSRRDVILGLLNEIDHYEMTLQGILAFCNECRWDPDTANFRPGSLYAMGRRMRTSGENKVIRDEEVTPDLLIQLDEKYGIVGEAKPTVRDDERLDELLTQLSKYDDRLTGWITKTEQIDTTDLTTLTHISNAATVDEYIRAQQQEGNWDTDLPLSVVSFNRDLQREVYIFLQKRSGIISNDDLSRRLHNGVSVPLGKLEDIYTIKFHDSAPPPAYLMSIIWDFILPQLPSEEEFVEAAGVKTLQVSVDPDVATQMLREQFSPPRNDARDPEIPRRSWVVRALDAFVQLGLGEKESRQGQYTIAFRRGAVGDNPIRFFVEKLADVGQKRIDTGWERDR